MIDLFEYYITLLLSMLPSAFKFVRSAPRQGNDWTRPARMLNDVDGCCTATHGKYSIMEHPDWLAAH
jgi:hypothetical protein